jgi:hypothetical protein
MRFQHLDKRVPLLSVQLNEGNRAAPHVIPQVFADDVGEMVCLIPLRVPRFLAEAMQLNESILALGHERLCFDVLMGVQLPQALAEQRSVCASMRGPNPSWLLVRCTHRLLHHEPQLGGNTLDDHVSKPRPLRLQQLRGKP